MVATPPEIVKVIDRVLSEESRRGGTTVERTTALVTSRLNAGGMSSAFRKSAVHAALLSAVKSRTKRAHSDNVSAHILSNLPDLGAEALKIPAWICVHVKDGSLVPSIHATADEWEINGQMKSKKAQQTYRKAEISHDISRLLREAGASSLSALVEVDDDI